jgi:hypothetical protein
MWDTSEMYRKFPSENLKGDPYVDGRIILKWIVKRYGIRMWTGFMWLRIGSCSRFLGYTFPTLN